MKDRNKKEIEEREESTPLIKKVDNDINLPITTKTIINELKYLISSSIPIILSTFVQFATPTLNLYSQGHIGTLEISAAALAGVFYNTTGNSINMGMATALDTLCSQAFTGSQDKHKVGLYLQKGLIIQNIMSLPIFVLWWNSKGVLLFLNQPEEIAILCSQYLRVIILGTPPYVAFELLKRYLQAQGIMRAQTWVMLFTLPFTFLINYLLMWNESTSIGFIGAAYTIVGTNWINFILMVLYINYIQGKECWGGFSKESLEGWKEYIKLGLSGIVMVCSEWWAVCIISLSVSYLGTQSLAAHSIGINIDILFYAFAISLSIVASNRIGNLLGSAHINNAKLATHCLLGLTLFISSFNAILLYVFKSNLAALFTKDLELQSIIATLMPKLCFYHVFDSIACVSSGILRGQGRQKIGAVINLISWYGLAIPFSLFLAFHSGYGVQGMWVGLCIALFCTGCSTSYLVLKSDWEDLIEKVRVRLSA